MKTVEVTIQGISPLLMAKFTDYEVPAGSGIGIKGDRGTPRDQAKKLAYVLKGGELYIPGECIYAALLEAGKFHKSGRKMLTTARGSLLCGGMFVDTAECKLGTKKWEVDSRPVVLSSGPRIMRHRPRLDKWETTFDLSFDEKMFAESLIRQIVDDCGMRCGLLDYRPQRKGPFGRFKVIKWDLRKN